MARESRAKLATEPNYIAFYLRGVPYTAKDLGDELLDMDIRELFQAMIDRGMVEGVEPGSTWYEHLRIDRIERLDQRLQEGVLSDSLVRERRAAEERFLASNSDEDRQALIKINKRLDMANKLVAD